MKKLLACVLTSTCVLCFTDHPAFAMKREREEDQKLLSILGYGNQFLEQVQRDIDKWTAIIKQEGNESTEK